MGSLSGVVTTSGYRVLTTAVLTAAGYGLAVTNPPSLPLNPYYGFTFPVVQLTSPSVRLAGIGRKLYRDGAIVFPPYPDGTYDVIVVWSASAVGRNYYLQW